MMRTKTLEQLKTYEKNPRELRVALGEYIKSLGIVPTKQYVKVLEYLMKDDTHPTVDDIFLALSPELPELSRSRVYSILETFVNVGAIRIVQVGENNVYYDAVTTPHAHFICVKCGNIENMRIKCEPDSVVEIPDNAKVDKMKVMCLGLCPNCNS